MGVIALTVYMLVWPAAVAVVMVAIARGFFKDLSTARKEGKRIV